MSDHLLTRPNDSYWPRAAVPNVRRKRPSGKLPSTTDKIARLACSFLTNRVPETNFPLKSLD
jgi:hypothetical protein